MQSGIYAIRHLASGKSYIGSAVCIKNRWACHISTLRSNKHHSSLLQRAWNKHGEAAFAFEVVEFVDGKSNLLIREQYWILSKSSADRERGYNICPFAMSAIGVKRSEETKRKLSEANKGKPGRPVSDETRQKLRDAHKVRSRESYSNLIAAGRMANNSRITSPETKLKISAAQKGVPKGPMSESIKRKLSEANLGKRHSAETIAKMSATRKGKPWSDKRRLADKRIAA